MKKNRITTTSVREIRSTFKRFLSLLIMSLLGVGVFVGIQATAPDMINSLDKYYDENNAYDIKLLSTLGITDDDIDYLNTLTWVDKAFGSHSKDVLFKTNESEYVIKIIGLTSDINKVSLLEGRMPKSENEIVVESSMLKKNNLKIGDFITIDDDDLKSRKLTITGTVKSSLYITNQTTTTDRGNTNLGTGKISYYAYVMDDAFKMDYYTESYVLVKDAKKYVTNDKDYVNAIDNSLKEINKGKSSREKIRYDQIYNQVNDEIKKQENKGFEELSFYERKLNDANNELKNGQAQLKNAKNTLIKSAELLDSNKEKLVFAKMELDNAKNTLDESKKKIDYGYELLSEELENYNLDLNKLDKISFVMDNPSKENVISIIPNDLENYDEIIKLIDRVYELGLDEQIAQIIDNPLILDNLVSMIPKDDPNYEKISNLVNVAKEIITELKEAKQTKEKLDLANIAYLSGKEEYDLKYADYQNGLQLYNKALKEYQSGLGKYNESYNKYNNNLNLYNEMVQEYNASKSFFESEINNAKEKLNQIPQATWYVYDRLDNSEYSNYIDDTKSISNLSKVFPTVFFIVAVLISLISMSRMVEDDRTQIGTLKSLGFSNKHILFKYLLYSGIATIFGGIIGSILGFFIIPKLIWNIYAMLFDIPNFVIKYDLTYMIVGIVIAIVCICGTTLLTVIKVVREKPSDLMRPKAPKAGKRVLIERIPFIWRRIKFSNKVTIRNLFRYKKRVLMTVVGILGCTSLMLSGFGLRDSIVDIPKTQYGKVFNFDDMIYLESSVTEEEINNIFNDKRIKSYTVTNMVTGFAEDYSINIFVPDNVNELSNTMKLNELNTGRTLNIKDNEVIISDKLSQLTGKNKGDYITIKDNDGNNHEFKISAVCENYVGHYVFMNKKTYESNIDDYHTNVVYIRLSNLKEEQNVLKDIMKNDNVMSTMSMSSTIKTVDDMLKSLDSVVFILIILSAILSFVVLYNLSYINISERKREIATLKVLGFKDKEVDNYITKENIILTIIGIIFGLLFGVILTNFIINTVEIEMVRFIHHINIISFVYSALMTIIFTVIVNFITHFTLKKINMIDSLKSVE